MDPLLQLLEENARLTNAQLAAMLAVSEAEVAKRIEAYEQAGIIRGYQAAVDWERTDRERVQAIIEVKISPKAENGFDETANLISQFPEVESCYLMSGGYDVAVMVNGRTFQEIAYFVSHKLAPLEGVQQTGTHFVLRKYKDRGLAMEQEEDLREDLGKC